MSGLPATSAQAKPRIEPREAWSAVFGETAAEFSFGVAADEPFRGRMAWAFSVNQRTLARGEVQLESTPEKRGEVSLKLTIPPVKPGVVFPAKLELTLFGERDSQAAATLEKQIWIFPTDPFADRTAWLTDLKITLFDPEGDTQQRFDKEHIPYSATRNPAVLEGLKEGMVVVGEGASWKDFRWLPASLIKVAAAGVPVLCLCPADGSLPLPGSESAELPVPMRMTWKRQDAIVDLDKRLDAAAWPGGGMIAARLALDAGRGGVAAVVSDTTSGWPWLELRYPDQGATLVVCGFGIVRSWDDGPTPRFLLARVLETLNSTQSP